MYIDFYESNDESSMGIMNDIENKLNKYGLEFSQISSYCADNCSVNYGNQNSVYQKLVQKNADIIKANCNCHVIHNAGRNACKALSFHVENLVLKVFAEFSHSAKRNAQLKECFEFLDMEFEKVLRHVVTRWLSLASALERLILSWPAVK